MTEKTKASDLAQLRLLGYFDQQVLAAYRNEPDKYTISSDYFEGALTVTNEYYSELEAEAKTSEYISVRFGYRTLRDGNLAIAAWLPDLMEKSKAHVQKWAAFHLKNPQWTTDPDERFNNWLQRYVEGSWDIDNGPLFHLGESIKTVNGLTSELVGVPLYKHEVDQTLGYSASENTHRYQDAHNVLYGYFIDGLDKKCISALALKLGKNVNVNSKKTVEALTKVFPSLETSPSFTAATSLVSEQRRHASHGARPQAKKFSAFSKFTEDLSLCVKAVKEVLTTIEKEFGVNGAEARKRHDAKRWLPIITNPPQPNYSIVQARLMVGKTIERVEVGTREPIEHVHGSEAIIIHFTDGSIVGLSTGSNIGNLTNDENGLRPEDFSIDFHVDWVPERPKGM